MVTKLPFLPDEHHYAIANVAVRLGQLDYHVEHIIYVAFFFQRATAKFILKNLGADRLAGLSKSIMLDTFPDEKVRTNKIFEEIARVRSARNDIMHSVWGKSEKPDTAVYIDARPFREGRLKSMTAEEIQKIADDAMELTHALIELENSLHAQLPRPSLDKLLKQALPPNSP
jgi:hypothetical protein